MHTNSSILFYYLCFVNIDMTKRIMQRQHDTSNLLTFGGSSDFFLSCNVILSLFSFSKTEAFELSESKIKLLPLDYSLTYYVCYVAVVVKIMVKQSIVISFSDWWKRRIIYSRWKALGWSFLMYETRKTWSDIFLKCIATSIYNLLNVNCNSQAFKLSCQCFQLTFELP